VTGGELLLRVEQVGRRRAAGESLEGQRGHEALRRRGERDAHLGAGLPEEPRHLACLVRRDPSAYAEQDPPAQEDLHGRIMPPKRPRWKFW